MHQTDLYHSYDFICLFSVCIIFSILKFHNVVVYHEFVLNGATEERERLFLQYHTLKTHPPILKFPESAYQSVLEDFNYLGFLYFRKKLFRSHFSHTL